MSRIRPVTIEDLDWCMDLARHYYRGEFDEEAVRRWFPERMKNPDMIFLRGELSGGVTHCMRRFHVPDRMQGYMILLYGFPGAGLETFRVLVKMIQWAKERGATRYWFSDISGYDLGPFAERLGGKLMGHNYSIDLDGKGGRFG